MRLASQAVDTQRPPIKTEGLSHQATETRATPPASTHERLMAGEDLVDRSARDNNPFRGGQEAAPTATTATTDIGTTGRSTVTNSIRVTAQNYELMRRLDGDRNGVLTHDEARPRMDRAGLTRLRNETTGLSRSERQQMTALYQNSEHAVSLTYGGADVGTGTNQTAWATVQRGVANDSASDIAPLGTVGQSRPRNLRNNDCGPTSALYMSDRRTHAATGTAPQRTHAQADRMIRAMSMSDGTTAPQMAGIMDRNLRHAGGRRYTHQAREVNAANLSSTLREGLASDPGGVMMPIISTYNENDESGFRHWIVVTGIEGNNVNYYDPGGPDGANHENTMPLSELRSIIPRPNGLMPNQVVYGTGVAESSVAGRLATGRRIGELEVSFSNRDLNVSSSHGVYGNQADAQQEAQRVAAATGEDAVVRQEGGAYAVYGITEIRDQFGGLWSDNSLSDLDSNLTDVYMTDQTSGNVRRATTGP